MISRSSGEVRPSSAILSTPSLAFAPGAQNRTRPAGRGGGAAGEGVGRGVARGGLDPPPQATPRSVAPIAKRARVTCAFPPPPIHSRTPPGGTAFPAAGGLLLLLQRENGRQLLPLEDEARVRRAHGREEVAREEGLVVAHAAGHDLEQVVGLPAHRVALEHRGKALDEGVEALDRLRGGVRSEE